MIKLNPLAVFVCLLLTCSRSPAELPLESRKDYPDVQIAGAMRNVMWKGELDGIIDLDTIAERTGLYGIGPVSHLAGELLINDGRSYVSRVATDSTMMVTETYDVSAPFFVYTNVTNWRSIDLPEEVKTIRDIERFVDRQTTEAKRPFAFKLVGTVASATIHVQNLPPGTRVSSPKEAHQGQTNYLLGREAVEIVGFFSTEHKGVFTHHDSFIHLHLITADESRMGHLDEVVVEDMRLLLPEG